MRLAYTPFVVHYEGERLLDHCGQEFPAAGAFLDDEGSVLIEGQRGIALLDDRDLERYAESGERLPRIARSEVEQRFGFVSDPGN